MSYQSMESRRQDGMLGVSTVKATSYGSSSLRTHSVAIMMRFVLTLCICSLPVHSMSIQHRDTDNPTNETLSNPINETPRRNLRHSDNLMGSSDVPFSDIPPPDAQELLDSNAVLRRSYAEARAGCSNMSSAHLLKSHVEKLRKTANGQVDLVFLVDSSTSVGITDFFNELKFVRKLLAGFEVAEWATRVAVITFASRHRVVVNIDHLSQASPTKHKCSLLNAELPGITYVGGGTYTLGAFVLTEKVFSSSFARPNATKAVFLITDGYSNGGDPRPIAQNLIRDNVEIFTFGIRNGNVKELHAMASEPKFQHCYMLDSFEEFEALARRALHEDLHLGEFVLENVGICSSLCPQGGHCCHPGATCRCGTTTGQYECICPQGYHGSGIVGGCHACPAGTYKPRPIPGGISTCIACPDPNHTSPPASTSVSDCTCRVGYQAVPGEPACQMIKCPLLSPPTNGLFVSGECSNTVHSACALLCTPGYELIGQPIMVCNEDGSWSDHTAICRVKKCHPLQQIASGAVHCTKEDFAFDTECTTLCNRGYILVGSKMRRCLPIALWDGLPSICRAVTCVPLEAIPNASLEPSSCSVDRQAYGTECSTVCHPGYQLKDEGESPRRCLASGLWSPKPHQLNVCTDVTVPDILCPSDVTVDAIPNDSVANVSWATPLTVDNSGEDPALTVTPAVKSPWLYPIGDTIVTYSATDKAGNTASCSFTITVIDSQPPVIEQCHSPGVVLAKDDHNQQVAWDEPQFSDNSGRPVSVSRSHSPGILMSWGTTNVEYIARDETGNTKSCHITVNVQQTACVVPQDPQHGQGNCQSSNGVVECSPRCEEGYAFPIQPEPVYRCASSGQWTPSHALPWDDCSKKENPSNVTQPVKVTFPVHFCNQDLAAEMAANIRRSQENKVDSLCRGPVDCRFAGIKVHCRPKGSIVPGIHDSRGQRQQLRGDISFERQQLEKLRKFPSVFVDMNITGKLNLPEGVTSVDEDSYQELRSSLSSVSNSLLQSLVEEEDIPLEMGAQTDVNSLIILPVKVIPVCQPGSVVQFNHCLQCAIGTFYNEQTSECERCPQGSYQDQPGQLQCRSCPPGTSTATTRAQSVQDCKDICSPGSHSDTGLDQCETCPRGSYQRLSGSTECVECPAGTSTIKTGATSVVECVEPCQQGYVSRSGLVPCLPCPNGYYQPGISKTSCYKCPLTILALTTWADCIGTDVEGVNISSLEVLPYNDCFSTPCAHGGTCKPVRAGYVCVCKPGYTGITCDTDINDCDSFPCDNGASCQDRLNGFVCVCRPGFQGETCSLDIDECQSHTCLHDGTCVDGIASYQCVCARGYSGELCELEVNECLSAPCYHGGRCVDGLSRFTCDCLPGYYGTFCEMETDECQSNPCGTGATCHDQIADYRCTCAVGFTGAHCQDNIDECMSSPCQHGGTCVDGIDGYQCVCQHGFTGQICEVELPWDFTLRFDHPSTTDYVLMEAGLPDMQEVTAAFWMRSNDVYNYGSPFSYGAKTSEGMTYSNAFTLMDYSGFVLYIADSSHVSDVTANDGVWHHIAVTWTNRNGEWVIYRDGQVADKGEGLSDGMVIPGGGVFVVGQEQDSIGGDFASSEAFLGEITLMHIWDRALMESEILELIQACQSPAIEGVVLAWPDFLFDMYGGIQQDKNNFCQGCYTPLQPDYGDYSGYQTSTPLNVVYYTCVPGFEFRSAGYQQATCMISGDWLPYDPPVCQRKQCWFPGDIQNGKVLGTIFSYDSQVQYVCYDGYTLIGPAVRECLDTGRWSDYQPRCEVVECGDVPAIPNAFVSSPIGDAFGSAETTVTYRCNEGYRLQGRGSVTCGSDGQWSQVPECLPVVCVKPDRNPHSTFTSSEGYVLGARVTYNCYAGYQLVGNLTRTCQADATWSGASPVCIPLQCGPPPGIKFATYRASGFAYRSIARYSCAEGYQMHGNGSLRCEFDLKWVGEFLQCLPIPCPGVQPIRHGSVVGDLFHYGESVTYVCDSGYQLVGPIASACLARGVWSNSAPVCSPVSCGPPGRIQNGLYSGGDFDFMGVVRYLCDVGFILIGNATLSCDADGQWNGTIPHCEEVTCSPLPRISNAAVMPSTELEVYPYRSNVTFRCDVGYILQEGRGTLTCGLDGSWQGDLSMCEALSCDRLGGLLNGRLVRTGHRYNDTATYICQEGFNLIGDPVRVCQANGRWSGVASSCKAISCSRLPEVPYAKVIVKTPNESTSDESYPYRTKIRYRCFTGYQLHGDQELRCYVTGEWSAMQPSCQPIRCHDLPSPSHGQIHGNDLTFNKTVTYICNTGYQLRGQSTRTCLADGTWDGDFSVCKMVVCDQPDRPPNGRVTGHNFLYRGVVTYSCDQGYILTGASSQTCLATGEWSSSPPLCQPVNCGPPPAINNTAHSANSTQFGSLAYYSCHQGYQPDGDLTIRCGWNGQWEDEALLGCSLMSCDSPPSLEFGFVEDMNYYVGDTTEYMCVEGAVLHGDSLVRCLPNRTWTPTDAYCELITCPEVLPPTHGTVHSVQRVIGSVAVFMCDDGYFIDGTTNVTCMGSGEWNHEMPYCERVACPPPSIQNGTAVFDGHQFSDVVSYKCDAGYQLIGDAELYCLANSTWGGVTPVCNIISCGIPNPIDNGIVAQSEVFYEGRASYSCNAGYQLIGDAELYCLADSTWGGVTPVCNILSCGIPNPIDNGIVAQSEVFYEGRASYSCDAGYQLIGDAELYCLANSTWGGVTPVCNIISCGIPNPIDNGIVAQSEVFYEGKATYSCNAGYQLIGDAELYCLANSTWGGLTPVCNIISCGIPNPIDNGIVAQSEVFYEGKATYSCNAGYQLIGDAELYCLANSTWGGVTPVCNIISCGIPNSIDNGIVVQSEVFYEGKATYSCNAGYQLIGDTELYCLANSTWGGVTPVCNIISCGIPNPIDNGIVAQSEVFYEGKATYSCNAGYQLIGDAELYCLANSTWGGVTPVCNIISCGIPNPIDNGIVAQSEVFYEGRATYSCNAGYQLIGDAELYCLANSTWGGVTPVCNIISCGIPNPIDNGIVAQSEVFYEGKVTYSCNAGYQQQGEALRFCLSSGALSGEGPSCEIISCSKIPAIKHAVTSDTNATYGSLVSYQCSDGHYTVGHIVIECLSNGSWSQTIQECLPVSCGHPADVKNGNYTLKDGSVYESTAVYHCHEGYALQGEALVVCQSNAEWSQLVPSCQPVNCGPPPQIQNGKVTSAALTYPSNALYSCDIGYVLVGPKVKSCLSNGSWSSNTDVLCNPVSCDQPASISNGKWYADSLVLGSKLTYTCDVGHEITGSVSVRTCEVTGHWSGESPICQPIKCPPLSNVQNGMVVVRGNLQYGSEVEYKCETGYVMSASDVTRICQGDGTWSGEDLSCLPVSCGSPPDVANAYMPASPVVTFNTSAVYHCQSGYKLQGLASVTCLANGSWSVPQFQCSPISCGEPQHILNGRVHAVSTSYKSVAVYTCNEGYQLHGTGARTCLANRSWSATLPVCQPVRCGLPPSLRYAVYLSSDISLTVDDYVFGAAVHYTCVEGYQIKSSNTLVCQSNGTWNTTNLICRIRRCPPPSAIDNGHLLGEDHTFRSTIKYICDPGFEIIGSPYRTCFANDTWQPSTPTCARISCPEIVTPPLSTVAGVGRLYQDTLTFRCKNDLELRGARELRCTSDGTWDQPIPSCAPKSCGRPPSLDNGMIFGHTYQPGDTISYQCSSGYLLDGPSGRRCLPDYRWSGKDPKCINLELSSALNQAPPCIFPCLHGGTCVAPYQCSCPYGFAGSRCEIELCARRCIGSARCTSRHPACK